MKIKKSLQTCPLDGAEDLLSTKVNKSFDANTFESPELLRHRNNLRGLQAVVQELLRIIHVNRRELHYS